jgi:hypothetical protein
MFLSSHKQIVCQVPKGRGGQNEVMKKTFETNAHTQEIISADTIELIHK